MKKFSIRIFVENQRRTRIWFLTRNNLSSVYRQTKHSSLCRFRCPVRRVFQQISVKTLRMKKDLIFIEMFLLVSHRWKLHFEFVIAKTSQSYLAKNSDPSMSCSWSPASSIDVESMIWDLPIKVFPTNPFSANNLAKVPSPTVIDI